MTERPGISGNESVFDELVKLIASDEAIGFVGAGASAGLYPLWPQLIEQLADAAVQGKSPEVAARKIVWQEHMDALQAARQIRRRLETADAAGFSKLLEGTFGPKQNEHGNGRFTKVHAALARLGFRAFVTTNYDPGLKYACQQHVLQADPHPFDWRDEDNTARWYQDLATVQGRPPILHAHGLWDKPDGQVLDSESYRKAYANPPFRRLIESLWTQQRLVIVGFSFTDPWLRIIAEQALTSALTHKVSKQRHFAVVGVPESKLHLPIAELYGEAIGDTYHARALFYPIGSKAGADGTEREDHSALVKLLDELVQAVEKARASGVTVPQPAPDPLGVWFDQVQRDHRRLGDHFDRPEALREIEQAWVQVKVQPVRGLRGEDLPDGADVERLDQATTLDKVLQWPLGYPKWNSGWWLLEGPPGSGKTTLLRHLASRKAQEASPKCIPVFLSLPRLVESGRGLLDHATSGLELAGVADVVAALTLAAREGRLLILLDGFDEVPRGDARDAARKLFDQLRSADAWSNCRVVVSSRPIGRGEELQDLPRLDLLPLEEERRREFLQTWFRHAGHEDWQGEAKAALAHFLGSRRLREFSGIPLYLTLLAVLWQQGLRPTDNMAQLYDQIFEILLDGKHRRQPRPLPIQSTVRRGLRHLAFRMTKEDLWAEPMKQMEERLYAVDGLPDELGHFRAWRGDLRAFLADLYEQTQILGPHDGGQGDWRFWHRTFREALAAQQLLEQHKARGAAALIEWAEQLEEGGEGRWAEPLALLAGQLDEADDLVQQLVGVNPRLAVRATRFADRLEVETLLATLRATDDPEEREKLFAGIPDQLGEADACLALVERLRSETRSGFDLFWLWWIAEEAGRRWNAEARLADLLDHFFDHIPQPANMELFHNFDSPRDGNVPLWRQIPAGTGWIGSPEDEAERGDNEGPRHQVEIRRPYWLGAVPVTRAQYAAFDPDKVARTHPKHPAGVTWYEAMSFCRWLRALPGFASTGARLPEEEEWEYACRAGSETRFWAGDTETHLADVGWYDQNSKGIQAVGGKSANPWGLYDVHGNVWEWTSTAYSAERYRDRPQEEPFTVDSTKPAADLAASPRVRRVMRGGSCRVSALWCRSVFGVAWDPWDEFLSRGFRVLLSSAPSRPSTVDH